ncbi:hypothetical protein GJ629_14560 [Halapricum sp. CBA1109]|uniref:hypothetical protein n=1 Tax=Halapricum sp. CBA1109 TaxID=2668068 RepID=UPI0012FA6F4A|nr:hypothetical protein [Halapricum sp. CBA1109]MUV90961.1 hypothetical protein [Halapricum sp. CBA1109]
MSRLSRRRLLAVGGTVALGGCMGGTSDESTRSEGTSESARTTPSAESVAGPLGDPTRSLLDQIPASVGETTLDRVTLYRPNDLEGTFVNLPGRVGVEMESVDVFAIAYYDEELASSLWFLQGSFDASAPAWPDDAVEAEIYREPGLFVVGIDDDAAWQEGVEAVESPRTHTVGDNDEMLRVLRAVPDHPLKALGEPNSDPRTDAEPLYRAEAREQKTAQRRTLAVLFADPSGPETALETDPLPEEATVHRKDGRLLVFTEPNPLARDDDVGGDDDVGTRDASS